MKTLIVAILVISAFLPELSFGQAKEHTDVVDTVKVDEWNTMTDFGFLQKNDKYSTIKGLLIGNRFNNMTGYNGISVEALSSMRKINGASFGLAVDAETFNGLNIGLLSTVYKFRGVNVSGGMIQSDTTYGIQIAPFFVLGKVVKGVSLGMVVIAEEFDGIMAGNVNGGKIRGLQVGLMTAGTIKGVVVSCISRHQHIQGISASFIISYLETLSGLNVSTLSSIHKNQGVSISLLNYSRSGQDSLAQTSNHVNSGVEIGAINVVDENRGLQLGLFNNTNKNRGLQIGLINISNNDLFPFVKWW